MPIDQPDLQLRTLRLYGELLCRHASWSHKLTLAVFEGSSTTGLAAASSLVGAASLTVDSNTALVKEHYRDGAFDFIVTTLDEALRALKNEIRQGRPIAIGLTASPSTVLEEAAERGLAPDFVLTPDQGATDQPTSQLEMWLAERNWQPTQLPTTAPTFDDPIRHNWIERLPTFQRSLRGHPRYAWLTPPR